MRTAGEPNEQPPGAGRRRRLVWPAVLGSTVLLAATGAAGFALGNARSPDSTPALLTAARTGGVRPGATVTVTGSGSVEGRPDTVSFQIGVETTDPSASTALDGNDSQVAALESTLASHGVARSGMQTSDLSISANTSHGVVTGFTVDDDLDVTMHDVAAAGPAIEAAAQSVGNGIQLYGISFSIANDSHLLAVARAEAMANARTEAAQLARGAGTTLGPIRKVTDDENASPVVYGQAAAFSAAVPIEQGSQPVSVEVTVVYALGSR